MSEPTNPVTITFRIPGAWANPGELIRRLPAGFSLTADGLVMPDSTRVEVAAYPPDDQFAGIFRSSCRRPTAEDELAAVDGYKVNVCLSGPGGSLPAALRMMRAASAVVRAGGAGVFIDNSALAHGGRDWIEMTEDGGPDAISFAFVAIVGGKADAWTMGMHALGLRDVVMKKADLRDGLDVVDVIRYLARGEKPVGDGHVLADLSRLRFRVAFTSDGPELPLASPMHNPFGRMRLVNMRDAAEAN